jgi:hypothetical protein
MLNLGAADNRSLIMMATMKYGRVSTVSARINGLAVVRRFRLGSHPRAEQRVSKVVGALEVCANALQQRTGSRG